MDGNAAKYKRQKMFIIESDLTASGLCAALCLFIVQSSNIYPVHKNDKSIDLMLRERERERERERKKERKKTLNNTMSLDI